MQGAPIASCGGEWRNTWGEWCDFYIEVSGKGRGIRPRGKPGPVLRRTAPGGEVAGTPEIKPRAGKRFAKEVAYADLN